MPAPTASVRVYDAREEQLKDSSPDARSSLRIDSAHGRALSFRPGTLVPLSAFRSRKANR